MIAVGEGALLGERNGRRLLAEESCRRVCSPGRMQEGNSHICECENNERRE